MDNNLYKRYYILNNSLGEVVVDRKTKEIIKEPTLISEVKNSIVNQRKVEFNEIKEAYSNYFIAYNSDGIEIAVDRKTGIISKEKELIDKIKFAIAWVDSIGLTLGISPSDLSKVDEAHRFQLAFRHDESLTYNDIIREVQDQLMETGNIDTFKLNYKAEKCRHALTVELYEYLLNDPKYLISLYNWVRDITPESLEMTEDLTTLSGKKVNSVSHKLN